MILLSMRTLFHYPLCSFCRKIRLQLHEKKLAYSLENEPIWKKREEFLDLNPTGQVPVLVDNDIIIADSQAISEYLEEAYPEVSLLPHDLKERAEVRRLIGYIDGQFYNEVTRSIVFEKTLKRLFDQGGPDSRHIREGNKNLSKHLEYFSWLIEKRTWLAREQLTLADLALSAHLSCLDYLGHVSWESYPDIKEWYTRLKSRPSFQPLLADSLPGIMVSLTYRQLDF
jgi:glutathione S-transferase